MINRIDYLIRIKLKNTLTGCRSEQILAVADDAMHHALKIF